MLLRKMSCPVTGCQRRNSTARPCPRKGTYEVNANNQLGLAPLAAFHLSKALLVRMVLLRGPVAVLLLHGVARRGGLLVELLLMLRGVCMAAASVNRRWRHGRVGPALARMLRAQIARAGIGILV